MAYNQGQFGQAPGYPGVPNPGPYTPQGQQPHFGVPAAAPPAYGAYTPVQNNHQPVQTQQSAHYSQQAYSQPHGQYPGGNVHQPPGSHPYSHTPSYPPAQYPQPPAQGRQYTQPPTHQGGYADPSIRPPAQSVVQYGYPPQQQSANYGNPSQSGQYGNAEYPPPQQRATSANRVGGSAGMLQEKKQAAVQAFQTYDRDRSGFVDCREFYSVITRLVPMTWEDACAVFAVIDDDRNGRVSLDEFIAHYVANY
eukprot:m.77299 g.77299  ORF g.77299 m.77299 type:complete len:251 (-) comp16194_c0_seq2:664-1416(-)